MIFRYSSPNELRWSCLIWAVNIVCRKLDRLLHSHESMDARINDIDIPVDQKFITHIVNSKVILQAFDMELGFHGGSNGERKTWLGVSSFICVYVLKLDQGSCAAKYLYQGKQCSDVLIHFPWCGLKGSGKGGAWKLSAVQHQRCSPTLFQTCTKNILYFF